jgi:hypothetical protein
MFRYIIIVITIYALFNLFNFDKLLLPIKKIYKPLDNIFRKNIFLTNKKDYGIIPQKKQIINQAYEIYAITKFGPLINDALDDPIYKVTTGNAHDAKLI